MTKTESLAILCYKYGHKTTVINEVKAEQSESTYQSQSDYPHSSNIRHRTSLAPFECFGGLWFCVDWVVESQWDVNLEKQVEFYVQIEVIKISW